MKLTGKQIYASIHDFREMQQGKFYDLPLNVILALQNNHAAVQSIYTILRQTEQIILDRHNYENYESELDALMEESFDVNVQFFSQSDIEGSTVPVSVAQTVMLFVREGV